MHKFLRSIGFSTYRKKRDIEKLLASLIPSAKWRRIQLDEETNLCELRAEVAPGMGIVMMGEMDEEGAFQCKYYYPYLNSSDVSSTTTARFSGIRKKRLTRDCSMNTVLESL